MLETKPDQDPRHTPLPVDWALLPGDERVLVAVSGGADSMALLLAAVQGDCRLTVAHINHGLRGEDSDADEAFVAGHCQRLGIPCVTRRVTIPLRDGHVNEAAARAARYGALLELAQAHACRRIATGHTASDLLETVLINWLRGAAVIGLQGIRPVRRLTDEILLVRPLLVATRAQAQDACRRAGWGWRDDASNLDPRFLRNRVRRELLPLLSAIMGPERDLDRLARQTARACTVLRDEHDYLAAVAREQLTALTVRADDALITLDGVRFRALPAPLQRRVLRAAVQRLHGEVNDLSMEAIEAVRAHVLVDGRRKVWQWRRGVSVEWTGAMAGNRIRLWVVSDPG